MVFLLKEEKWTNEKLDQFAESPQESGMHL